MIGAAFCLLLLISTSSCFEFLSNAELQVAKAMSKLKNLPPSNSGRLLALENIGKIAWQTLAKSGELSASDMLRDDIVSCLKVARGIETQLKSRNVSMAVISMLDAAGKPGSGITQGDLMWLGSYSLCVSVNDTIKVDAEELPLVGKSCRYSINIWPLEKHLLGLNSKQANLYADLCIPDVCPLELLAAMNYTIEQLSVVIQLIPISCHDSAPLQLSVRAIVSIAIVSVVLLIVLVSTSMDLIVRYRIAEEQRSDRVISNSHWGIQNADTVSIGPKDSTPLVGLGNRDPMDFNVDTLPRWQRVILAFSIYTNTKKLFKVDQGRESATLGCVQGLKFLSMAWVILGHTYAFGIVNYDNWAVSKQLFKRWSFQAVLNATVSVDTFFAMSGLLLAYTFLREMDRRSVRSPKAVFMYFFHRFWRLTPAYMFVLMCYHCLLPYMSDGPLWNKNPDGFDVNCNNNWWTNLLYVNNLVKPGNMCMGWSWYLANDMQFHWLARFLLLPIEFFGYSLGYLSVLLILLISMIVTGVMSDAGSWPPSFAFGEGPGDYFEDYYVKPYCRIGSYLVGMMFGFLVVSASKSQGHFFARCMKHTWFALICWAASTTIALVTLFGLYDYFNGDTIAQWAANLYNAASRSAWAVSIGWIIVACIFGKGFFINKFLSWSVFYPLGRLTYCAYLVHPAIIYTFYLTMEKTFRYSDFFIVYLFLGNLCTAFFAAYIISMIVEVPFMNLEKVLFSH